MDNVEDAKEAWEILKGQFQRVSLMQKIRLRKQYYQLEFQCGGDIHGHNRKLCELHNEMKELGEFLDDKDLAMTLLASLPFERYQSLIVSLDVAGEANLSFNNVKALLLNKADRLADSNTESQRAVANFASTVKSKSKSKGQWKCYDYGKKGHFAKECRNPQRKEKGASRESNYSRINAQVALVAESQSQEEVSFALTTTSSICRQDGIWVIDSGASQHMVSNKSLLHDFNAFKKPHEIRLAGNCNLIYAVGEGNVKKIKLEHGEMLVDLKNVLYVPDLADNLLSVHAMTMNGASVMFTKESCKISAVGKVLGVGKKYERLFGIKVVLPDRVCVAQIKSLDNYSLQLWHKRMGHKSKDSVCKLQEVAEGITPVKKVDNNCVSYAQGKQHRNPFSSSLSHSKEILQIVHSDVLGPFEVNSIGGSRYACVFINDKSRFAFVYMLRTKSEVFAKFTSFVEKVQAQTGKSVKIIRSDNGGEYSSKAMKEFCIKKGIQHQYSISYTPEQNVAEHRMVLPNV